MGELEIACSRTGPIIIEARFDRSLDVAQHEDINQLVTSAVENIKA
jgi:hypothetical protein